MFPKNVSFAQYFRMQVTIATDAVYMQFLSKIDNYYYKITIITTQKCIMLLQKSKQ